MSLTLFLELIVGRWKVLARLLTVKHLYASLRRESQRTEAQAGKWRG